jgi:hypothetical protein
MRVDNMIIKTLFSILSIVLIFGCSNNELGVNQSDTVKGMSKPIKNEISMDSYYPSPSSNIGLENEVLLALTSKFGGSSGFDITVLDHCGPSQIKPMYYVWVNNSAKGNSHQKGLALVMVGTTPEVLEYYKESEVIDVLGEANPSTNLPKNIIDAVGNLLKQ